LTPTDIIDAVNAFMSVYQFLKDMKRVWKMPRRRLFSMKKIEGIEERFREALNGTKNAIEYYIWFGIGFAIQEQCGAKIDREFHFLMGRVIYDFNDIYMRLDPEKLDEKLIDHLIGQLKILENYAQRFWQIQGISSHEKKEEEVMKIIENFDSKMRDFQTSMEPYLKSPQESPFDVSA
jgi:hypothetical protein